MNLQNLIDYAHYNGFDLLDGVTVPDPLQTDTVKSAIVIRCGLLTPVFSEPQVMREYIRHWFTAKQWTISHLIKVIQAEYSPIENYDRQESWTDDHSATIKDNGTGRDVHSGSEEHQIKESSLDTHNQNTSEENKISAYNSDEYQPDTQRSGTDNWTLEHENTAGDSVSRGETINRESDNTRTDTGQNTHMARIHGNVGVTTNQQMIEQELELLRHFDIYTYIAKLFEEDCCLMIY